MNNYLKKVKMYIPIILIFVAVFNISFSMEPKMNHEVSDADKPLYEFINRQGKILEVKYHIKQIGDGIGGMDKVWLLGLDFQRYGAPLTEKQARRLIIQCVDDFLMAVNNEEQLRTFLQEYPFTAKNVELAIHNFDQNRYPVTDPFIVTVSMSRGEVGYYTIEKPDSLPYKTKKYETYDEAVAILKNENTIQRTN
jgi:hypothetical protein